MKMSWIDQIMGVDIPELPPGGRRYLEFAGLPQGEKLLFALLVFSSFMAATVWLYKREGQAQNWQKMALAAVRIGLLIVAFIVFTQPRLATEVATIEEAKTLVLVDNSLSMSLKDRIASEPLRQRIAKAIEVQPYDLQQFSRAEVVEKILNKNDSELLKALNNNNPVSLFQFSGGLEDLAWTGQPVRIKPKGQVTNLSRALRDALEQAKQGRTAGLVLFTDGRRNVGEHPGQAAGLMKNRKIPLFAIGLGDPAPPKNFEVSELTANPRVYKNDFVIFMGQVKATGFEGEAVNVIFERLHRTTQKSQIIETRPLQIQSKTFQKQLEFRIKPKLAGSFLYSLKIEPRAEELTGDDNIASRSLEVLDKETRVLLIAGTPSYEFRRLRNLLIRERTIQVSCWLQTADDDFPQDGNLRIRGIPRSQKKLFQYDVVILTDPGLEELGPGWLTLLKKFVEVHGGGLCFIAGDKHSHRTLAQREALPLRQILPIIPETRNSSVLASGKRLLDAWPVKVTADGQEHSMTRLVQQRDAVKRLWNQLPGLYWFFPTRREKPGAAVLLRSTDPSRVTSNGAGILLAAHFYGPGRTVFQAFDSSWRWRQNTVLFYQRYWIQLLRYLVEGRLLGGQRQVSLETDKDIYELGDMISAKVRVLDRSFRLMENVRVSGTLVSSSGETREVLFQALEGRPGHYAAKFVPERPGLAKLNIEAPEAIPTLDGKVSKVLRIQLPNLEFQQPSLDKALLQQLCQITDGKYLELNELETLPKLLPAQRQTIVVAGAPISLWDNRLTAILMISLLTIEWWFRKRCRMV